MSFNPLNLKIGVSICASFLKWQDQMFKEVGLNIPTKWEETIKSTPSKTEEFTVTLSEENPRKSIEPKCIVSILILGMLYFC